MPSRHRAKCVVLSGVLVIAAGTAALAGFGGRPPGTAPAPGPATAPELEDGWAEFTIGTDSNIDISVRVRQEVSIADYQWMEFVLDNHNGAKRIANRVPYLRDAEINESGKAPRSHTDLGNAILNDDAVIKDGMIPAGVSIIPFAISAQATAREGLPQKDAVWHVHATLWPVAFQNGAVPRNTIEFNLRAPNKMEIQQAITKMHEILHQPTITTYDANYVGNIVQVDAIAAALTVDEALAQLQIVRNFQPARDPVLKVIAKKWPHDPKVIDFLRKAIEQRDGNVVGRELSHPDSLWDDALIEPLVTAVEKPNIPGALVRSESTWLHVLDAHADAWKEDKKITRRLGDGVAKGRWGLQGGKLTVDAANLMGMARDTRDVPRLRPFLDDKTVVSDDAMSQMAARRATLRTCDIAYAAIVKILGEEDPIAAERERGYNRADFDTSQKERWDKWDKAIDALKAKLDKK